MTEIVSNKKTQQFANLVRSYRKSYIGKGPEQVKVFFKDNWAVCHMSGSLSKVENFICEIKILRVCLNMDVLKKLKNYINKILL